MKALLFALVLGVVAFATSAIADNRPVTALAYAMPDSTHSNTPGLDKRERHQQARIKAGVKSGALTKGETVKLERQEAKLRRNEAKAKADGTVTEKERVKLNKEANKVNRDIVRQKHDKQIRK